MGELNIVLVEKLIDHPSPMPPISYDIFPLVKWNRNTIIKPRPGYIIAAILILDEWEADKYREHRLAGEMGSKEPTRTSPPDTNTFPALREGERRWHQQ